MTRLKSKLDILVLLFAIIFGFAFRLYGLNKNYSFWVDEASTARFGRAVLETKIPKINSYLSDAYYVTHYLTGISFYFFGQNEFAARLPEVIFGTILIFAVYFLGKNVFNSQIGVASALFTAFSYLQIAWSRQARGYVILECFFILYLAFFYLAQKNKNNPSYLFAAILFLILSIITHTLGLTLIIISIVLLLLKNGPKKVNYKIIFCFVLLFSTVCLIFPIGKSLQRYLFNELLPNLTAGKNFIAYYHSLFWRNYSIFVLLTTLGFILLWLKKERILLVYFSSIFMIYLFTVVFLLFVPFEKYVLVLFPIMFLLSSYALYELTTALFKEKKSKSLFYFLIIFILFNGNKFTLKPKLFYSLNFDMREIPEIDYKKYYELVKAKANKVGYQQMAIVDIDEDAPAWYLGEGKNYFNPRNDVAGKIKSDGVGAVYIHNLEEFGKVYKEYKYGFIFLIEHNFRFYPEGLVEFARRNMNLEGKESFASFSPDWNYWPVELYSWGFNGSGLNK